MPAGAQDKARLHACAFNGRDIETLMRQASMDCKCIRDGQHWGEGPEAVGKALREEFRMNENVMGRLAQVDGQPVLVEFDESGGWQPRGLVQFRSRGDRIEEVRIDHRAEAVKPWLA